MKTELRLESVVADGVAGPQSAAISAIYSFLLYKYGQNVYRYIHINQIDSSLEEVIIKRRKTYITSISFTKQNGSVKKVRKRNTLFGLILSTPH